jgi:hypothetical protein
MPPGFACIENDELKYDVEYFQEQRLEVQPVGGHDADVGQLGRLDHAVAFLLRHRERLLAQHVLAGLGGAHHVILVLGVGRADVDGIHFLQHAFVIVVRRAHRNAVLVADLVELLNAAADDSVKGGVTPRVRKRRQHRGLRDVSQANHCVTNLRLSHFEPPSGSVQVTYQSSLVCLSPSEGLQIGYELLTCSARADESDARDNGKGDSGASVEGKTNAAIDPQPTKALRKVLLVARLLANYQTHLCGSVAEHRLGCALPQIAPAATCSVFTHARERRRFRHACSSPLQEVHQRRNFYQAVRPSGSQVVTHN